MKLKANLLLGAIIIGISVFFMSCSDDSSTNPKDSNVINVEYGEYYPTKTGTWWEYERNYLGNQITYRVTCEGTKIIDGKEWVEIGNSMDKNKGYIRYENGKYYQYIPMTVSNFTENIAFLYMDENAEVEDSWTINVKVKVQGSTLVYDAKYTITMVEKLDTYIVRGKTYKDVIAMELNLSYMIEDMEIPLVDEIYYHAKGIGVIKAESEGLFLQELLNYKI